MSSELPRAGWYADPQDSLRLRFWNGQEWTQETFPHPDVVSASSETSEIQEPAGFKDRIQKAAQESKEERRRAKELAKAHDLTLRTNNEAALNSYLQEVVAAAQKGNIVSEESHRAFMLRQAKQLGGSTLVKLAEQSLRTAQSQGLVRINSQLLGEVKSEGFFSQYTRKEKMTEVKTAGKSVTVFSDRILQGDKTYVIDEFTGAQVTLDGQSLVTTRPTLTRMVLMAPLPGSALLPGLALPKTKRHDDRHAEFMVVSKNWAVRVTVNPDSLGEPRRIAEQINRHADALTKSVATSMPTPDSIAVPAAPVAPVSTPDSAAAPLPAESSQTSGVTGELERLGALVSQGLLTDEEFSLLKAKLIQQHLEGEQGAQS